MRKRIDIVKIQQIKEGSIHYAKRKISSPRDAADIARQYSPSSDREELILICLNTKNEPTHITTVSVGSLNSSIISPREVYKTAILANSNSILLLHNHPSGDTEPSHEDILATQRLLEAGSLMGIELLDHIIFTPDSHLSIRESGRL
ncbi:JAB domain-containing protein [Macrococcoides caseolyticum]|uniref:JAB domain-containing protein n=1 Tax=Macrococcoides caseolyticum TaxID=69966 RepID=UPI000C330CCD|nr:JAB domain-containing protein [Macrococcus caseolyticus]PKE62288.1 DNA repair protein RadC [Macrococcus caseolyticus]